MPGEVAGSFSCASGETSCKGLMELHPLILQRHFLRAIGGAVRNSLRPQVAYQIRRRRAKDLTWRRGATAVSQGGRGEEESAGCGKEEVESFGRDKKQELGSNLVVALKKNSLLCWRLNICKSIVFDDEGLNKLEAVCLGL
jgi:hypothetical protein